MQEYLFGLVLPELFQNSFALQIKLMKLPQSADPFDVQIICHLRCKEPSHF